MPHHINDANKAGVTQPERQQRNLAQQQKAKHMKVFLPFGFTCQGECFKHACNDKIV